MSANPFPEHLRGEYDARLVDVLERQKKARQLQNALEQAHLWAPPRSILDVGCGTGLILANLSDTKTRVGCDVRGELFVRTDGIAFVQARANQPPFQHARFDLVLCMAMIEELADWRSALAAMAECVAQGGVLYVTFTNGRLLTRVYSLLERFGIYTSAAAWHYARKSLDFPLAGAPRGFDLHPLQDWQFVNVTPHLARAVMPSLRRLPVGIVAKAPSLLAPSFGYAWRKPILGTQVGRK